MGASDTDTYIQHLATDWPPKITTSTADNSGIDHRLAVSCDAQFTIEYEIPVLCVSIVCFLLGLVYSFFGYRFFKAVLFLTGLIFGSILIYLICDKEKLLPQLGNAGVAVGAGILFGLVTMLVEYVGVFMSGFLSGLFLGIVIMLILYFTSPPTTLWVTIGVLFLSGLVLALVTLKWQRIFLILGTTLMGGAMISTSLDYVANKFALVNWIWSVLNIKPLNHLTICWYGWLIFGLWPAIFLIGTVVQFRLTSVGFSHKDGSFQVFIPFSFIEILLAFCLILNREYIGKFSNDPFRSSSTANLDMNRDQPNPDTSYQPKPFRQLYQARRNQGDVICQSYMESMQRLQQGTTTLSSDNTRLTVLSTLGSNPSSSGSDK